MATEPTFSIADEDQIANWIEEGSMNRAWNWILDQGDPETWVSRIGRTIAARLFQIRGAVRQSDLFHLKAYREFPDDPQAIYYGLYRIEERRGQWPTLNIVNDAIKQFKDAYDDPTCADLFQYRASIYSDFRDFDRAWKDQDLAEELNPGDCFNLIRRGTILLAEDRTEESLEIAEEALRLRPNYRSAISFVADLYWSANRDEEAFQLLLDGLDRNEGAAIAGQLMSLYDQAQEYEKGLEMLEIYEQRSPMADKDLKKHFANMKANFHYLLADGKKAAAFAKESKSAFYKQVAERVESGQFDRGERKVLPVKFVRQNELTCAPATLTAISQYWGKEADHLAIAEEICYDGTPGFKERAWAIEQGWIVYEFTANTATHQKLIDAGIPYCLSTVEPTSAHLQAMIGYDSRSGSIIIRDPGHKRYKETLDDKFFENYAFSGPRAMLLLPPEEAHRLEGISLPDKELFDTYYQIQEALDRHERETALEFIEKLDEAAPGHRLAEMAKLSLHYYDRADLESLPVLERLSEAYPNSKKYRLDIFWQIKKTQTRNETIQWLRDELSQDRVLTTFYLEIATLLAEDSRTLDEAMYYFRRALHFRPLDADVFRRLADALWNERMAEQSRELYRLASSLELRNESHAEAYFKACRCVGEPEAGLAWLKKRFERFGSKSSGPVITLIEALRYARKSEEVERFELLDSGLELLPDDGSLLIFAANEHASVQRFDRSHELLEAARGRINKIPILKAKAHQADLRLDSKAALSHWQEVLMTSPLDMEAHRASARISAEQFGVAKTVEDIAEHAKTYPNYVPLQELHISWLRDTGPGKAEECLREFIINHPSNAWAVRELAIDLQESGKFDDALTIANQAVALRPHDSYGYGILGSIHADMGEKGKAIEAFKSALKLDVENTYAMRCLVENYDDDSGKREALTFIEEELVKQVLFGDSLESFRTTAFRILKQDELLKSLIRAHQERPDLWQTWSALINQYLAMAQYDEALEVATGISEKFSTLPVAWIDLATVYSHTGEIEKEIEAIEGALKINPQWDRALRLLSDAREKKGDFSGALEPLYKAVESNPLTPRNHGCLADTLWKAGKKDEAFQSVTTAAELDCNYSWAWDKLAEWASSLDKKSEAIEAGRKLVTTSPASSEAWQRLRSIHLEFDDPEAELSALDEGLTHCPRSVDLHDIRAVVLSNMGRYREAIDACYPEPFGDNRPHFLVGREAWVENSRGNQKRAIELLEEAIEGHSDWLWGYERLADWYAEAEKNDEALKAVDQLVRLSPRSCTSHGFRGDLLRQTDDEKGAIESFSEAFRISPTYNFAAWHLTDLLVKHKRFDEAEAVIEKWEYHNPENDGPDVMRVKLFALQGKSTKGVDSFKKLISREHLFRYRLIEAEDALKENSCQNSITPAYRECAKEGHMKNEDVASRWAAWSVYSSRIALIQDLKKFELEDPIAESAWRSMVVELIEDGRKLDAVAVVTKNKDIFRSTDALWATGCYALRLAGKNKEAAKWSNDWSTRENLEPWMMVNVALPNLVANGLKVSGPIHKFTVEELPIDHDTPVHYPCLVTYEALYGDLETAKSYLEQTEVGLINGFYQSILKLGEYAIQCRSHDEADIELLKESKRLYPEFAKHPVSKKVYMTVIKETQKQLSKRGIRGWALITYANLLRLNL